MNEKTASGLVKMASTGLNKSDDAFCMISTSKPRIKKTEFVLFLTHQILDTPEKGCSSSHGVIAAKLSHCKSVRITVKLINLKFRVFLEKGVHKKCKRVNNSKAFF